jgi:hypothetical protein
VSIREFYEKDGKQIPTAKGEHICILLFFGYLFLCSRYFLIIVCIVAFQELVCQLNNGQPSGRVSLL